MLVVVGGLSHECAKVDTLLKPDREKKTYVPCVPDNGALDVITKIGVI